MVSESYHWGWHEQKGPALILLFQAKQTVNMHLAANHTLSPSLPLITICNTVLTPTSSQPPSPWCVIIKLFHKPSRLQDSFLSTESKHVLVPCWLFVGVFCPFCLPNSLLWSGKLGTEMSYWKVKVNREHRFVPAFAEWTAMAPCLDETANTVVSM